MSMKSSSRFWLLLGAVALLATTALVAASPAQADPQRGAVERFAADAGVNARGHSHLLPEWDTLLPPAVEVDAGGDRDDGVSDTIVIELSGSDASISVNGAAYYSGPAPHIAVEGSSDDDLLQVVVTGGAVSTIQYNGRDHQTETGDVLDLVGDVGDVAYYPHSNGEPRSGTIVASGGGLQIEFGGLEPVALTPDFSVAEPDLRFFVDLSFAPEVNEVIIEDDPTDTAGPGSTRMVLLSDTRSFEWASFVGFTSIVLWSGAGPETIRYRGVDPASGITAASFHASDVVFDPVTNFFASAPDNADDTIVIEVGATELGVIVAAGWLGADTITVGASYGGDVLLLGGSGEVWADDVDAAFGSFTGDGLNTLTGGSGDDLLTGGDTIDRLRGGDGNDVIEGYLGIDRIWGGNGDDDLLGGGGSDRIKGGPGVDFIFAGSGADRVWAGTGDDVVFGQGGQDFIWGEGGNDELQGNDQSDDIWGGNGDDLIGGSTGKDEIWGGNGNDTMNGGPNSDTLQGGDGIDTHKGGPGRDTCTDTIADSYQSC